MKIIQLAIGIICLSLSTVVGQSNTELPPTLKRFVNAETVAIGHVDVASLDYNAMVDWALESEGIASSEATFMKAWANEKQKVLAQLQQVGITNAYVLMTASDVVGQAPYVVVPIADPAKCDEGSLEDAASFFGVPFREVVIQEGIAVLSDSKDRIEAFFEKPAADRAEATAAWRTIKDGQIGIALIGDDDSREVIRQLFPPLPSPFEAITGKMIADELKWSTLAVDLPPTPAAKLVAETENPQAVAMLKDAATAAKELVSEMPIVGVDKAQGSIIKQMVARLDMKASGNRFEIDLENALSDERGKRLLGLLLREARGSALDSSRVNKMKEIYLAILNFESAYAKFPAYATFDDNQKPLLSWRVRILQFLEEDELFEKFRHDEPWDSEHNLKLVKEIPLVFQDPGNPGLNAQGKTRIQCPYGEGYFMEGDEQLKIGSITDGTSLTLSIVRVNPELAVPWTKPADFNVDAKDPWKGIRPADKKGKLIASMSDGSVHRYSQEMTPEVLLSILTRNGSEPVDRDDLK